MSKKKNVIGEVYNRFTIIEMLPDKVYGKHSYKFVKAKCQCGNTRDVCYKDLTRGLRKSCGCINEENKTKVEEGQNFTHWTVLKETEGYFDKNGEKMDRTFLCGCVCGKEKEVNLQSLKKGSSKSCGCQGREKKVKEIKEKTIPEDTEDEQWKESKNFPGYYISTLARLYSFSSQSMLKGNKVRNKKGTRERVLIKEIYNTFIGEFEETTGYLYYKDGIPRLDNIRIQETKTERVIKLRAVYANMKVRCNNPKNKSYCVYGAKGIKVEESFNTFPKFFLWAIENGYEANKGLEIDRKDPTKGYSVENCRWVTKIENGLNVSYINLTLEDVRWIRSDDFTYEEAEQKFIASRHTIENIREYRTFVEISSF